MAADDKNAKVPVEVGKEVTVEGVKGKAVPAKPESKPEPKAERKAEAKAEPKPEPEVKLVDHVDLSVEDQAKRRNL